MDWYKVSICKHEWSNYHDSGTCDTPYCTWTEKRCIKCKVYIMDCGCRFMDRMSGEPFKTTIKRERRRQI